MHCNPRYSFLNQVMAKLLDAGADTEAVLGGMSCLDIAVEHRQRALAQLLLSHGANPSGGNLHSLPHHVARLMCSLEPGADHDKVQGMLSDLLEYGADPDKAPCPAHPALLTLCSTPSAAHPPQHTLRSTPSLAHPSQHLPAISTLSVSPMPALMVPALMRHCHALRSRMGKQ